MPSPVPPVSALIYMLTDPLITVLGIQHGEEDKLGES